MNLETNLANSRSSSHSRAWLLILGIILLASTLRAPLTAVGPLIGFIRDDTGISNTFAGLLTTFPLLAFAFFSPLAPKLARRFGTEYTLFASLIVMSLGIVLRSLRSLETLLVGTALIGIAIAFGNVLLPSLIKRDFPEKVGLMTGIYSIFMNMWAAVASGISIPLAQKLGFGWRGSLICWSVLSIVSLVAWLPQLRVCQRPSTSQGVQTPNNNLWHSRLAWQVSVFMGLQSLTFYVMIAWLPEILHQQGINHSLAGWMLSLMQFVSLPTTLIIPVLAGRCSNQRRLVGFGAVILLTGYIGLLSRNTLLAPLWIVLIGIAVGTNFSLALIFFVLRTQNANDAAELSGMAQSIGYFLAAVGPPLLGFVHDMTQSWTAPLCILVVIAILLFIFGLAAGSKGYVTSKNN